MGGVGRRHAEVVGVERGGVGTALLALLLLAGDELFAAAALVAGRKRARMGSAAGDQRWGILGVV